MDKIRNKEGITLIALIITIIVMLILVAVTINMAVNGGLFGYASNAAKDTKQAMENEQDVSGFEDLVAEYTGQKKVIRMSYETARIKSISSFSLDENDPQHKANCNCVLTIKDENKEYDFNDILSVYRYGDDVFWDGLGIIFKSQETFRTCFFEDYDDLDDDDIEEFDQLLAGYFEVDYERWIANNQGEFISIHDQDVNYEYNGVKISKITYMMTSEHSADLYFDALVDMGRFWLAIPMETSISLERDAETGDPRIVMGEFPNNPDLLESSFFENLTPSDVGFSS